MEILPVKASSTLNFNYLFRVSLLALSIVLSLIYLAHLLFPDVETSKQRRKLSLYQQQAQSVEAIALGTSHSRGLYFPALNLKGFNFHDSGGDIEELEMKASYFLKKSPQLKTIFTAVSPGTLAISQRYIAPNYSTRLLIVASNTPLSIEGFLFAHEASISLFIDQLISIRKLRNGFDKLIKPLFSNGTNTGKCFSQVDYKTINEKYSVRVEDDLFNDYIKYTIHSSCMKAQVEKTVLKHLKMIKDSHEKEPGIVEHNMQRLINVADKLSKRGGKLVLVVMPMTKDYYQSTQIQTLVPEHFAQLATLEKHPNIEVYDFHDYFYDKTITDKNYYFHDGDHLAITGAIEFSKVLLESVIE